MTTARILDSGRERRTVELVPEPLVASYLMCDSAGCIIVTIGLPDPKRIVLKPQPELHPYIYAGHSPGCYQRESWHQQSTLVQFLGVHSDTCDWGSRHCWRG